MNDPVYVEAAQALGRLMLAQQGTLQDQIQFGFRRCVLRAPTSEELSALTMLYEDTQKEMAANPDSAMKLATDPLGPLPQMLLKCRAGGRDDCRQQRPAESR